MIIGDIEITVVNDQHEKTVHAATPDKNSSLMEFLVSLDYPILATCGGMALCGTCCIDVISTENELPDFSDMELDMLESLPQTTSNSRLSCQLPMSKSLNGIQLRLNAE